MRLNWLTSYHWTNLPSRPHGVLAGLFVVLIILAIVDVVLKGFAMWRAARLKQPLWFVVILVFNTLGILPLLYLVFTKPPRD